MLNYLELRPGGQNRSLGTGHLLAHLLFLQTTVFNNFPQFFEPSIIIMLSLRTISRAIPRTFSRSISTSALRPAFPKAAQPWKQAIKPAYAAFSTSSILKAPASEGEIHPLSLRRSAQFRYTGLRLVYMTFD